MTKGIYLFWDNKYEQVIYAGRFTGRERIKSHFYPSNKHVQTINRYVQNHPDRIESVIFCEFDDISDDDLNQLEEETIKLFRLNKYRYPDSFVFNFNDGGSGNSGYKKPYEDFEYTVAKAGFDNGKQKYCIYDRNRKPIKQSIDKEALDEIAEKLNNDLLTEEEVKAINLNPFKYTVVKAGFCNGKQNYTICDRDNNSIKQGINKNALDEIAVALNNGSLTEKEVKAFKYSVAKAGFLRGKQKYCIYDRNRKAIKRSIDKEALDEIAEKLNNGSLTEEEAKAINLNPFKYTVAKAGSDNGKQRYCICDRNRKPIKQSTDKEALDEIAEALNNGSLTEEEVKKSRGVKKIL